MVRNLLSKESKYYKLHSKTPLAMESREYMGEALVDTIPDESSDLFSEISPMDARESRRKKLTARILMLSMLFTMIGTLVLVIIGNQIDGNIRTNWLTNPITDVYITEDKNCNYADEYSGFDYLGYTNKLNQTSPFTVRFKKWMGQTICVRPMIGSSALNLMHRDRDSQKCPIDFPVDCGDGGCYPTDSECPITQITMKKIGPPETLNPKKQFCYGDPANSSQRCFEIVTQIQRTSFPVVQLHVGSWFYGNPNPHLCYEGTIRDPMRYDANCEADPDYTLLSQYYRPYSEYDLVKENLPPGGDYTPTSRDATVSPVLFSRPYIEFGRRLGNSSVADNSQEGFEKDEQLRLSASKCDVTIMRHFLQSTSEFSERCMDLSNLKALSFLLTIVSIIACTVLYRTRVKSMIRNGTFSLRLHALASLLVFGASIAAYSAIITIARNLVHAIVEVEPCVLAPSYEHISKVVLACRGVIIMSLVNMFLSFVSLIAYIYNSYILKHGLAP